jgi:hypothetical protein
MVASKKNRSGSEAQFPGKLHDMMRFVEEGALESIISWELNGYGIKINMPERLVEILPLFFGQTKYRSFRRQLNMWHFHRILEGPNKGVFVHPYFVQHNRDLCAQMSRHISFKPTPQKEQEYITLTSCIEPDPIKETTSLGMKILIMAQDPTKMEIRALLKPRSSSEFFKQSNIFCLPSSDSNPALTLPPLSGRPTSSFDAALKLLGSIFADDQLKPSNDEKPNESLTSSNFSWQKDLHDGDVVDFEGKNFFFLDK